jgi:hypothetical protein
MSMPRSTSPTLEHIKVESLQSQYELLNILRLRHLHWINFTDDPEIQKRHQEIADLIERMAVHYSDLLQSLELSRNRKGSTG